MRAIPHIPVAGDTYFNTFGDVERMPTPAVKVPIPADTRKASELQHLVGQRVRILPHATNYDNREGTAHNEGTVLRVEAYEDDDTCPEVWVGLYPGDGDTQDFLAEVSVLPSEIVVLGYEVCRQGMGGWMRVDGDLATVRQFVAERMAETLAVWHIRDVSTRRIVSRR